MTSVPTRRTHLDVMRGVAVLIMIEAHVIDSFTNAAEHQSHWFRQSMVLGGFAAPLFLFFAGVAVSMSAASKLRRLGDAPAAVRAVQKRGLQIFGLAFLFRLQSLVISWADWETFPRVDILNVMGLSIVAAAALWGIASTPRMRVLVFFTATAACVLLTPPVRALGWLGVLPDPIEAYIRPTAGLSNFTLLPWAGFVMAGALFGVLLDAARTRETDRAVNLAMLAGGPVLAAVAYQASFAPPLHPGSRFWTTSLSFFLIRLGLMVSATGVAWLWEQRPAAGRRWSPLQFIGQHSLFIYWVHVELVYGAISNPLHGAFTLKGAWLALPFVWVLMAAAAIAKDRIVAKFQGGNKLRHNLSRSVQPLMF